MGIEGFLNIRYKLSSSENFDDYMKELGKSCTGQPVFSIDFRPWRRRFKPGVEPYFADIFAPAVFKLHFPSEQKLNFDKQEYKCWLHVMYPLFILPKCMFNIVYVYQLAPFFK